MEGTRTTSGVKTLIRSVLSHRMLSAHVWLNMLNACVLPHLEGEKREDQGTQNQNVSNESVIKEINASSITNFNGNSV